MRSTSLPTYLPTDHHHRKYASSDDDSESDEEGAGQGQVLSEEAGRILQDPW